MLTTLFLGHTTPIPTSLAWPRTTFWWTNSSRPRHIKLAFGKYAISGRCVRHSLARAEERRRKITPTNSVTMPAEIQLNPRSYVRFYRILRFALRLFNRVHGRSRVLRISLFKYLQLTAVSTGNPFVNSFLCILMLFRCFRMNSSHEDSRKARNTRGSSFDFAFESG